MNSNDEFAQESAISVVTPVGPLRCAVISHDGKDVSHLVM